MKKKNYIIIGAGAALLIGLCVWLATTLIKSNSQSIELSEAKAQLEQMKIDSANMAMAADLTQLDNQYQQLENAAIKLENDSILAKYNSSKAKVEELLRQLNDQKVRNKAEIDKLQKEIESLRGLLRHYVAMVDSLGKENGILRENLEQEIDRNQQLTSQVSEVTRQNEHLTERMTLAEKLNVTAVTLTPLNKKGKREKNVTKARQLMVTFTIPQNNSTPVGEKTIYLRLTGPEGSLLGNTGSFSFEGQKLPFTARKNVEYSGDEITGITIYWDVNTTLNPGEYTVELFADNFRLTSRKFTLKK
ncbi:MAG: hypothetical protein U0M50_00590 [Paramuribaculum sp.]